jgi:hypothetical protein
MNFQGNQVLEEAERFPHAVTGYTATNRIEGGD